MLVCTLTVAERRGYVEEEEGSTQTGLFQNQNQNTQIMGWLLRIDDVRRPMV